MNNKAMPRPLRVLVAISSFAALLVAWNIHEVRAQTRTCAGVSVAHNVVVDGRTLALNGVGLREATVFSVDVFVAALYVERTSKRAQVLLDTDQRVQVVLHFVRATSRSELRDDLSESFDDNAPNVSAAHLRTFLGWLGDMAVGDRLIFTYVPNKGLEVNVRGAVRGPIPSRDFARDVLATLLGPHPKSEPLRTALLGSPCL